MQRGWTFGKKLAMGFSVVVGLMVLMAGSAWLGLDAAVGAKDRVIARTDQSLLKAKDLETSLARRVANARGYLLGGQARLLERTREEATISSRLLSELEAGAVDGEARNLLAEIREAQRLHVAAMDRLMAQRESQQDLATLADRFDDQTLPLHDQLSALVRKFARHESDANERVQRDAEAAVRQTRSWLLASVLAAVLSALGIGLHLVGTLTRQIASTVSDLRSASTELQAAATQQATSSKEQATAVQESLTTMKELLVTSRQIGESATHVSEVARGTLDATRRGEELARSGRAGNTEIRSQMGRVVDLMVELGRKSRQIGTVLALVNELAEQTNILAVNATIEATAAGESGIRFGAVADEIRGLADRVTGATREIQVLVEEVRSTVNSTVMATETGSKSVDAGARQFDDFAAAFGRIAELVANTAEAAREIELSIAQQQTAVEQVNVAVADVSQAAQESAASARQTQATSTQLVGLAGELHALIQDQDRASA